MQIHRTNYRFTIAGLLGLISVLVYAPEIRADERQQLKTEFNIETIEFNKETKFRQSILTDESIMPTVEIADREQWRLSQSQNNTSQTTNQEDWPEPVNDNQIFWLLLVDQLEFRDNDGEATFNWDAQGWIGGDYKRLWIKTEGDIGLETADGEAELQLLYSKLIAPFWDFQVGLRYDQLYSSNGGPGRAFGVIGVQGLAPYLFEVDAALFVSQNGDVSARLQAEYQLLLSERLILQPEFETNIAIQQVEDFGVGSGINDIELGLRLRYEISRKFAPYVGASWTRKLGNTADLAREEGESVDNFTLLGGVRLLF